MAGAGLLAGVSLSLLGLFVCVCCLWGGGRQAGVCGQNRRQAVRAAKCVIVRGFVTVYGCTGTAEWGPG